MAFKRLQKDKERLRKAVSDLTLDKLILTEVARGNFRAPPYPSSSPHRPSSLKTGEL